MTEISYASIAKKKKLKRGALLAAIITAGGLLAFNQFNSAESDAQTITPNKGNTLSISGPWEISSLDPSNQGYILTRMQVIETLLNVDSKGQLTAGLASDWQQSADGLSWLFTLREGVTFHDGSIMDAKSAVLSLTYTQQKHGTLNRAAVTNISAIDNNKIKFELAKPYVAFGALLTNYANAILSPASYEADGAVTTLYGSGPYQMEHFSPPHKLTVKKFADYWGQEASIDFATYLTGHRAESRLLQAKSGEADIVFTLDPSMLSQLKGSSEVSVHSNLIPRTMFVKLNAGHPTLKDIKVRQALSMALDRAAIASNVLHATGSETAQLLPGSMSQWFVDGVDNNPYDLEKAQVLLADAGWQRDESGSLTRDGAPLALTMITYADRPELTLVATAIQAQWAKLGVQLKVDVTNSSMIPAGHQNGSLEMALIARNFGFSADPLPLINSDFANGGGDWGTMNWHNPSVDKAMAELMQSNDMQRSYQLSQQVATAIYQDTPLLPIASYSQHTAVNQRVKNFTFDPFERNYFINQMELK